jgi:hypothetical protein
MDVLNKLISEETVEDARLRARVLKRANKSHIDPYRNMPINEHWTAIRNAFQEALESDDGE